MVVAVKGELIPPSAQPAVIAVTMAAGVTPSSAGVGSSGAISVTERQAYILRVRELAKGSAAAWLKSQGVEVE